MHTQQEVALYIRDDDGGLTHECVLCRFPTRWHVCFDCTTLFGDVMLRNLRRP